MRRGLIHHHLRALALTTAVALCLPQAAAASEHRETVIVTDYATPENDAAVLFVARERGGVLEPPGYVTDREGRERAPRAH